MEVCIYNFPEVRTFQGLFLQKNTFTVPDGALEVADNIIITSDNIISIRKGKYTYFTPTGGKIYNALFNYQDVLLSAYQTAISWYADTGSDPNKVGAETILTGSTISITNGRRSRSIGANSNLYFTTDNGPLKLTAYNSSIIPMGAPQGLDLNSMFIPGQSTWLSPGNVTGYRIVFGYLDSNQNLILGAPSSVNQITNVTITNAVAVASGTTITVTSTNHGLITGMYMVFSGAAGFATSANANGTYSVTVTDLNTFTYTVAVGPGDATGTVSYNYACPVSIEASIPSEITTSLIWFAQLYRASQQSSTVGIQGDYALASQRNLTSAEISAGVMFFTDILPEDQLGALLYTNENSQEGELQANYRPPLCDDMTYYKGYAIFGNCTTRQALNLAVINPSVMANNDYVEIKISATTRRYVARTGVGNQRVIAKTSSSTGLLITYKSHGFVNGDYLYVSNQIGGSLATGYYYVVSALTDSFKISLTAGGSAIAYNSETSVEVEGVTDGTYYIFTLSTSSSAGVRLAITGQGLVKSLNRDPSSLVYAQYASGPLDVPGMMFFQSKGFGDPIYVRANTTTAGGAFFPALPNAFNSGTQVFSTNDSLPNAFFVSKYNEPEAVPLVNYFLVGSKNKPLLRCLALIDSIIILKADGVFVVTGDNINNFTVTALDYTVICVAPHSAVTLSNRVVLLSNQGVCIATQSSVQIISRQIEDVIQPILGQTNLASYTAGISYESQRLYLLTTTTPNNPTVSQVYCYNILTNGWSTWDTYFYGGTIGPLDNLFFIDYYGNTLQRGRNLKTKIDYCDQNIPVTINTVAANMVSANVTSSSGVPQVGDIIVKSDVINRISSVTTIDSVTYVLTFSNLTNLVALDSLILYGKYDKKVQFSPFHAGLVGREKQYSQFQIHFRDNNCSALDIYFTGDTWGSSELTSWKSQLNQQGWGLFPWGFAPWGQEETTILTQGTQPAPMCRLYVPLYLQRSTFIQPVLTNSRAAEPMAIQAVSYTVRAYGERVSK